MQSERSEGKDDGEPETDSDGIPVIDAESLEETSDPLLNRLMTGYWDAVDEMSAEVEEDCKTVQEIVERMQKIQEKSLLGRTNEELAQDREELRTSKSQIRDLNDKSQTRDKLRRAGMTLQLYKTKCGESAQRSEEVLRCLVGP